ncbi:hypothetical protein MTBPR1_20006 [Candidatus Terasakiella magnetica]|uniref:Uncharacterized protein n=1 Tax=Candidatus Terasakiella magnetica TaxID=1867952 RepID=A0A1C3RFX5_9PROT|nr:hypothetical protein [Candidatus Terasakiella magnetica]SCA56158.1 hypothetical protein MTBPR1_20006 [Candidatus Terasakiella magnetica]
MITTDLDDKRALAQTLFDSGQLKDAIALQLEVFNQTQKISDLKAFVSFIIANQDYKGALDMLALLQRSPKGYEDPETIRNFGLCYTRSGQHALALPFLSKYIDIKSDDALMHDCLAQCYFHLSDNDNSRYHGACSLTLKDAQSQAPVLTTLETCRIPAFNSLQKMKNVIAFSISGEEKNTLRGALQAADSAKRLYGQWTCRFYLDQTVPARIQKALQAKGAELIMMDTDEADLRTSLWKLHVCMDEHIDRYLIRDHMNAITPREVAAVDQWINSDKHFHIMRDHVSQCALVPAGLWGGVQGALANMGTLLYKFLTHTRPQAKMDELFCEQNLWPTIKQSCLIHDSCHDLESITAFPKKTALPNGKYVGQPFSG